MQHRIMMCFGCWYRCIDIEGALCSYRTNCVDAVRNKRIMMYGDEVIAVAYIVRFNAYRPNRYLRPTFVAETEFYHFVVMKGLGEGI